MSDENFLRKQGKPRRCGVERFENPDDELNGSKYHTGKPCIEPDCQEPAGTAWSPYWCQKHNAERIKRIDEGFRLIEKSFGHRPLEVKHE